MIIQLGTKLYIFNIVFNRVSNSLINLISNTYSESAQERTARCAPTLGLTQNVFFP